MATAARGFPDGESSYAHRTTPTTTPYKPRGVPLGGGARTDTSNSVWSRPLEVDCFVWSQLDDGLDYRMLHTEPAHPRALRDELAPMLDSLGQALARALPYEAWMWLSFPALTRANACCCHITRGSGGQGRRKLILHAIAVPVAALENAGLPSNAALTASAIWQDTSALASGSAQVAFDLATPRDIP